MTTRMTTTAVYHNLVYLLSSTPNYKQDVVVENGTMLASVFGCVEVARCDVIELATRVSVVV